MSGRSSLPADAVSADDAATGHSFLVAEHDPDGGQRAVHDGFFLTVAAAESYRRDQPQPNMLTITFLIDRYQLRDLIETERLSGQLHPAEPQTIDEYLARKR